MAASYTALPFAWGLRPGMPGGGVCCMCSRCGGCIDAGGCAGRPAGAHFGRLCPLPAGRLSHLRTNPCTF